ncbi:MAG: helix-turn-helix domain-containing protein [Peptostreptococcaceae bacterium]
MQLSIGNVIYKLRKQKGITQENLAKAIGISTAAVSKWETGNAYPDITLLSPIARFLDVTVDYLLEFEANLTDEEVMEIYNRCCKKFMEETFEEAIIYYKKYIKQYPNSMKLKFRLGSMLQQYLIYAGNEENAEKMIKEAINLFEECIEEDEGEIKEVSLCILSSLYIMVDRNEEAVEVTKQIKKPLVDPDIMLSSIYYKMEKIEESKKMDQTSLYSKINEISNILIGLSGKVKNEGDYEYALQLAGIHKQIINLFELQDILSYSNNLIYLDIYSKQKDKEKTLDFLEKIASNINIFSNMKEINEIKHFNLLSTSNNVFSKEYLEHSINLILQEDRYDFVKSTDRYKNLENKF